MAAVCKTLRGNPAPTTFRSSFVISPWATNCSCRGLLLLRELGANSCFQRARTVTQVWSLWSFNMKFCSNEMRGLGFLHPHSTIQPTDMKPRLNIYLLNEPKKSTVQVERSGLRRGKDTQHSAVVWCSHLTSKRSMV